MTGPRYRALLIGNATFPRDPHALPPLHGPLTDIEAMRQALTDTEVGLFRSTDDVAVLPDYDVQDLRERLDEFYSDADREDVLLLYYSGHGEQDLNNTLYLCARDTLSARLPSTALSSAEINNLIDTSPATTTIVMLDCCHSGAFKGSANGPGGGRGRYVLTSSRSIQLAPAAAGPGQLSPFTALLIRGMHEAVTEPGHHLTVSGLYRQVHRWMSQDSAQAPQLRMAGEGEVVIARRPDLPLPSAEDQPVQLAAAVAELPRAWQAQRVRTHGIDCVLLVGDDTEEHTVEFRSLPKFRAVVFLDRRRIYQGPCVLDCEFSLGSGEARARLTVNAEPDIQLRVDDTTVYALRQDSPGSKDYLEHRAAFIRAALLETMTHRVPHGFPWIGAVLRIAPDLGPRNRRAVGARAVRSARLVSGGSAIAVVTVGNWAYWGVGDRAWFTDQAVHIRAEAGLFVVPYEELAATKVTAPGTPEPESDIIVAKALTERVFEWMSRALNPTTPQQLRPLNIGEHVILLRGNTHEVAAAINTVKSVITWHDTGVGDPPPVHRYSGPDASYDRRKAALQGALWFGWALPVVTPAAVLAASIGPASPLADLALLVAVIVSFTVAGAPIARLRRMRRPPKRRLQPGNGQPAIVHPGERGTR